MILQKFSLHEKEIRNATQKGLTTYTEPKKLCFGEQLPDMA